MSRLIIVAILLFSGCMKTEFWFEGDCLKKEVTGGGFLYGKVTETVNYLEVLVEWENGTITKEGSTDKELLREVFCDALVHPNRRNP